MNVSAGFSVIQLSVSQSCCRELSILMHVLRLRFTISGASGELNFMLDLDGI